MEHLPWKHFYQKELKYSTRLEFAIWPQNRFSQVHLLIQFLFEEIENNKNLMNIINEIKDASIEDGGSGAFYIYLKKKR